MGDPARSKPSGSAGCSAARLGDPLLNPGVRPCPPPPTIRKPPTASSVKPRPDLRLRQDRPDRNRPGPARSRRRADLHRRHPRRHRRRRPAGDGRFSDVTGFPGDDGRAGEDPAPLVHGGLLGVRDAPEHKAAMTQHGIGGIDLLYVNLYPFEATVASGADFDTAIENIDIGGPAMIRSAAKNHAYVCVCTEPATGGRRGGCAEGGRRHHP